MEKQSSQQGLFSAAPHSARIAAFVIDSMTVGILFGIISALVARFDLPVIAFIFIGYLAYFIGFPLYMGSTPGKKIMHLEIIDIRTHQRLSLQAILIRETIGRLFSGMFFGLGYLLILFDKDHEGIHDKLAKSQVVTFHAIEKASLLKLLGAGISLCLITISGFIYVFLYTTYPIQSYLNKLEMEGISSEGLKGNLMYGFSLESLNINNKELILEGKNLQFKYDLAELFGEDSLNIQTISAHKIHIELAKPKFDEGKKSSSRKKQAKVKRDEPSIQLNIAEVDIHDFRFKNDIQTFDFRQLRIDELELSEEFIKFRQTDILSDYLNLSISSFFYSHSGLQFSKMDLLMRKELFPEILSADLDVSGQLGSGSQGYLVGLKKAIEVSFKEGQFQIQLNNFQPHWYFKKLPPVHSLNATLEGPLSRDALNTLAAKGTFFLRNRKFSLMSVPVQRRFLAAQLETENLPVRISFLPRAKYDGPLQVVLFIESAIPAKTTDVLGQIYFSKDYSDLKADEVAIVKEDLNYILGPPEIDQQLQNRGPASQGQ